MNVADMDEIRPAFSSVTDGGAVFSSSVVRSAGDLSVPCPTLTLVGPARGSN